MSALPDSPAAAPGLGVPAAAVVPVTVPALGTGRRVLRVQHETRYDHGAAVELAHHVAYLRPRDTDWQRVRHWQLQIDPPPQAEEPDLPGEAAARVVPAAVTVNPAAERDMPATTGPAPADQLPRGVQLSQDGWGNWRANFNHATVHERLRVCSTFVVELQPRPAWQVSVSPPWEAVRALLRRGPCAGQEAAAEFALPSAYAPVDAALERFGREAFAPGVPLLTGALSLMNEVYQRLEYRPAATTVATRAPEALAQRRGVCQDFAHIMIGAMRSLGLAARYVSGYLLTEPPPGQPRLVGADATHAWMEAWCPAHGWIALDPTNAVPAGLDHVTMAWGRDYADVAPLRGVIRGGGQALPHVAVTVEPWV